MKGLAVDPYCYPGTNTLKNLPDIRDAHLLDITESALTASQSVIVESQSHPPHDLARLLFIHRTLFGKLYPFAGELRQHTGTMAKVRGSGYTVVYGDSASVPVQIAIVFANSPPKTLSLAWTYPPSPSAPPTSTANSTRCTPFAKAIAAPYGFSFQASLKPPDSNSTGLPWQLP
jgi:hypothetical protein